MRGGFELAKYLELSGQFEPAARLLEEICATVPEGTCGQKRCCSCRASCTAEPVSQKRPSLRGKPSP